MGESFHLQRAEEALNRLEELDVVILDHNGCAVSFTKNFSKYIDTYVSQYESNDDFGYVIKRLFRGFTNGKRKTRNEKYHMYYVIMAEVFLMIINDPSETCEEYRQKIIKELKL